MVGEEETTFLDSSHAWPQMRGDFENRKGPILSYHMLKVPKFCENHFWVDKVQVSKQTKNKKHTVLGLFLRQTALLQPMLKNE